MSDYLWDKSGAVDPEVERLEQLLAPLAHRPSKPKPAWSFRPLLAVAAALVAIVGTAAALLYPIGTATQGALWAVEPLMGAPRLTGTAVETDGGSRARVELGVIGFVDLEPGSRLRLVRRTASEHRVALDAGTLHARIWAPPRLFVVDTPSAAAVDLGCAYTLRVEPGGGSLVEVTSGWVAFEAKGRESFIPAGAACRTHPEKGPGVPWYVDAPERLKSSIDGAANGDVTALAALLEAARARDGVTLWHLLRHGSEASRGTVYARLAALAPPPAGVTREGVLAGDRRQLDAWWDTLGLGEAGWWRLWRAAAPR